MTPIKRKFKKFVFLPMASFYRVGNILANSASLLCIEDKPVKVFQSFHNQTQGICAIKYVMGSSHYFVPGKYVDNNSHSSSAVELLLLSYS